jgi:hypothetical protein
MANKTIASGEVALTIEPSATGVLFRAEVGGKGFETDMTADDAIDMAASLFVSAAASSEDMSAFAKFSALVDQKIDRLASGR